MIHPKYPVYIISKGRWDNGLTARMLIKDRVKFHLVVEPQEAENYAKIFGKERLLILPFSNLGLGGIPARNWVWEHAKASGSERHWILDDNIRSIKRLCYKKRIRCSANYGLSITEDFVDRYQNVAVAGLNYVMFAFGSMKGGIPPFYINNHVYSCLLILNSLPMRWRGRYNEDTDLCLQVLSAGWCTILMNAFLIEKMATMTMKGGNSSELYKGDGRLKMARSLERVWPGVVETKRRFKRPQHVVKDAWRRFDTPLKLKQGLIIDPTPNNYGMKLVQVKPVKSPELKALLKNQP